MAPELPFGYRGYRRATVRDGSEPSEIYYGADEEEEAEDKERDNEEDKEQEEEEFTTVEFRTQEQSQARESKLKMTIWC